MVQLLRPGRQHCQQQTMGGCCVTATAGVLLGHILKSCCAAVMGDCPPSEKKCIDFGHVTID